MNPRPVSHLPALLWVTYGIIVALLGIQWAFTKTRWFLLDWAEWGSAAVLFFCGVILIIQGYLFRCTNLLRGTVTFFDSQRYFDQHSVYHFHRPVVYMFFCFLCIFYTFHVLNSGNIAKSLSLILTCPRY